MNKVLIVSRTRMTNGICVGGINIDNNTFVRLHDERGGNLSTDAPYQIGEIWNLQLDAPWNPRELPHVEDKMVKLAVKLQNVTDISSYIRSLGVPIYEGDLGIIFEGSLKYTLRGKPFINDEMVPPNSVCFWIPDANIVPVEQFGKIVYKYKNRLLPYVGFQDYITIAAGTLVRMSLANWWQPEDSEDERRCYVQLSGWY